MPNPGSAYLVNACASIVQNVSGPGAAETAPVLADWIGVDVKDCTEPRDARVAR